jgi:iron complex outermembrane recepter protein
MGGGPFRVSRAALIGAGRTPVPALLVCAVITLFAAAAGRAQTGDTPQLTADIPAQSLVQALTDFARQTKLELIYVSSVVGNQRSSGVPAGLSAEDALARLLAGTGLRFEFLTAHSVRILAAEAATPSQRPSRPGPEKSLLTEEVIVTATKRAEPSATVPMSVSVLSSEDLRASGIRDIEGIAAVIPGIEYDFSSQFGSGTVTNLALRGINSTTGQSTTALYLDEAPIHAWHVDTGFGNPYPVVFDLARVEILRGPQGTLFGTGAEGGAIRLITNEPSMTTFDGLVHAESSATEHGDMSFEVGAAFGGPLIDDRLGARVGAWYRGDGGFVDRVDPFTLATVEENANRDSLASTRLAFAFAPSDTLRITPSVNYQSHNIHDSPNFYTYLSDPKAGILRNGKLLRQPAEDRFSLESLNVEAEIATATLTAATSYLDRTSYATIDQTNQAGVDFFGGFGNPLGPEYPSSYSDAVANVLDARQFIFSQEVRLATRSPAARLTWVIGAFYAHSRVDSTKDTYAVTAPQTPGLYDLNYTIDSDLAAFGDATLRLSRRWRVSLGARLARTKTDSSGSATGFANPVPVPFYRAATDSGALLAPRFAVSYETYKGDLLYMTAAKGFRAGGVNVPQCGAPPSYAPDYVSSYEVGTKNSVFSNRLRLTASIFYAQWSHIQELTSTTTSCFVDYTSNLGTAVSRGFDLTADSLLGERTHVGLTVGYLDAHYTNSVKVGGDVIVATGVVVGALPSVPAPWSLVLNVEYRLPMGVGTTAYAGASAIVHSHNPGPYLEGDPQSPSYNSTAFADPATKVLNLNLGVLRHQLDLKVSLINLLNSQPLLQHDSDASGSSLQYAHTFRPRTIALSASQRF